MGETAVFLDDDREVEVEFGGGDEFLNSEHEAAITSKNDDWLIG